MSDGAWKWFEAWLSKRTSPRHATAMLGDLSADYARCRRERGSVRAMFWLYREAASLVIAYWLTTPHRRGLGDMIGADIRHSWRSMRARPGASLGTILVLALGIGLVSSMFALADPYVTRPLPFADAERLVNLTIRMSVTGDPPSLDAWRTRTDLFSGLATIGSGETVVVSGLGGPATLRLLAVSSEYLKVLGIARPALVDWRTHPQATERPVVLTASAHHRLGDRGGSDSLLRTVDDAGVLTGSAFRVRGSLPQSFLFPSGSQAWDGIVPVPEGTPLVTKEVTPARLSIRRVQLKVLARLQPDVSPDQVTTSLSTAPTADANVLPSSGYVIRVDSIVEMMTARLWALAVGALAAGALVLMVCAANVSNLLIARGAFRQREFATREALGASGFDLSRLVLVELALLTVAGIASGLLVARGVLSVIALYIPAQYIVLGSPAVSLRTVVFACLAGGLVVLAGLVPALAAWRVTSLALFTKASHSETRGIRLARFSMTAAQTAVAVVLLVGAMLMGRSFVNLVTRDPGYAGDVFVVGVRYEQSGTTSRRAEVEETVARLKRLDGVTAAAATAGTLVENIGGGQAGPALLVDGTRVRGLIKTTGSGFFQVARARLLEGRLLNPTDDNRMAVVGESFARTWNPERSIVGRRVEWTWRGGTRSVEIVGVVKDILSGSLDQTPTLNVFVPMDDTTSATWVTYVFQTDRPTPALGSAIEREIKHVSSNANVAAGALMRDRLMRSIRDRSFATLVVTFFALAAIGVSAAGLIGVVSFIVARRTREIAIRVAIGAGGRDVRRLVTREVVLSSIVGGVLGLVAGGWLSRTMEMLLFGIQPADPLSMALAALALVVIVMVSAWVPVRRALKLSPLEALRAE